MSVNYLRAQGEHQFYSQNINAPINGVYPTPPPPGGTPIVTNQYQSGGIYQQNQVTANINLRAAQVRDLDRLLLAELREFRYQRIRILPHDPLQPEGGLWSGKLRCAQPGIPRG